MQPRYEYTTSDQVLTTAKFKLGIEGTTVYDAALRIYMQEGLGELPSFDMTEYKTETIEICDTPHKMAKLPCGFIRFVEPNCIRLRDSSGNCWFPRTTNNVMFPSNRNAWGHSDIQLNNGYIYFGSNITATEADVYFLSVLLDESGRAKIPVSHSRTVQEYMMAQWYETRGDNRFINHEAKWARGKRQLKAKSLMPNINEKEEIYLIWNSLL